MINLGVILGSTRPGRLGEAVANWFLGLARETLADTADCRLVDIADQNLPFYDEASAPIENKYRHAHTLEWAKRIAALDGFVFVLPEYNHGIPAALKNTIDYLFKEWNYKPAAIVSYGGHTGGVRAAEQLRCVLGELKVYDLREQLPILGIRDLVSEGRFAASPAHELAAEGMLSQLAFWAEELKASRQRLP